MSRSPSADVASPVFGRFLLLVRDWNTGELLPLGRNVVCQCAMCARRRTLQSSPAGAVERPRLRRAGFTLVEMVVVLLILALLTVAAVQSLSPVADQARYEATTRTLAQIQQAIVGERGAQQPDGVPLITGFVADTGRLPISLDELVNKPADVSDFGLAAPSSGIYSTVQVPRGWRGPYLQLPSGETQPADGWGLQFDFATFSPGPPVVPLTVASQLTPRAGTDYAGDISISIGTTGPTAWSATLITGTLYRLNGTNQRIPPASTTDWKVTLIGPGSISTDDGSPAAIGSNGVSLQRVSATVNLDVSFQISTNLSIGPRAIRAEQSGVAKGQPVYITLRPGATHIVDLLVE